MEKKPSGKLSQTDDGRVIAPMNVDGMPWYFRRRNADAAPDEADVTGSDLSDSGFSVPEKLTRRESLSFTLGVLSAALLAALVFIGGLYLFILFCIHIWFS